MIVVGLTGGIASGKSTALAMFKDLGCAVWSADAAVHDLYAHNADVFAAIQEQFPECIVGDNIDRACLGDLVFKNERARTKLEALIHPLIEKTRNAFLKRAKADIAVLEIPLLFEKNLEDMCDYVVVIDSDAETQKQRLLARPYMTPEKAQGMIAAQIPLAIKREKGHFVISSMDGLAKMRQDIEKLIKKIKNHA